jgi:hypothetical protein
LASRPASTESDITQLPRRRIRYFELRQSCGCRKGYHDVSMCRIYRFPRIYGQRSKRVLELPARSAALTLRPNSFRRSCKNNISPT